MTGHLVHIGYAKTGSNFLRRWFATHPQLAYADGGIAGFRDVYEIAKPGAGVRYRVTSCEALVTPHRSAGNLVVDEESIRQQHDPELQAAACATLADLFPNAHVLIMTRGFRSMILSSYSQYVRSGGDRDLQELVATARSSPGWKYDEIAALYAGAFGEAKVIVMPYELLRDDAYRFTRALEERLGLDHVAVPPGRFNASLSGEEMIWYPRLTRFVRRLPVGARLRGMYARGVTSNRFRAPIRILQRIKPSVPVTAASIPDEVLEFFRGRADRLCMTNPLYEPYREDYLVY